MSGSDFENDPAADFLAREQEDLANIDDDMGFSSVHHNENGNDGEHGVPLNGEDNEFDGRQEEFLAPGGDNSSPPPANEDRRSPFVPHIPEPESEKVVAWRTQFAARIEAMDEAEVEKKEVMEKEAKKALEDWLRHLDEQQNNRRTANRQHEEALMAERAEDNPGDQWERVCRLCEFNPKAGKAICAKDTSRMRGILLQLKQEPLVR